MSAFMIFVVLNVLSVPVLTTGDGESYEPLPFVAGGYDDDQAQRSNRRAKT